MFECDADADLANLMGSVEEGEEERAAEAEEEEANPKRGRGRRGQGKGRGKGKAVKQTIQKEKKRGDAADASWKKCKSCAKWKDGSEYNQSQAKCKKCFNDSRSLLRVAERQQIRGDLVTMEENDPKQYQALLKSFAKERERCAKTGERLKFSLSSFKLAYKSETGLRTSEEGEMMWEGEFYEFAKSAKMGFLSKQEAEAMWSQWEADKDHPRDKDGPRNYLRLYVKVRDVVSKYQDISKKKEVEREERLGKNPSAATLESRMKLLTGDVGMECHDFGSIEKLQEKAAQACGSGLTGEGLLAPDVTEMLEEVKAKHRKRSEYQKSLASELRQSMSLFGFVGCRGLLAVGGGGGDFLSPQTPQECS